MDQCDTSLLSYLHSFDNPTDLLLIGDLNLPDVDWNTYSGYSTISNAYAEIVFDLDLMQLIDSPTHTAGNILDVILTNSDHCQNIDVHPNLPPSLSSDHHIITFSIVHHHNKASDLPKYKYNYYQANWADMNQYLYSYNLVKSLTQGMLNLFGSNSRQLPTMLLTCLCQKYPSKISINLDGSLPSSDTKSSACVPRKESMRNTLLS